MQHHAAHDQAAMSTKASHYSQAGVDKAMRMEPDASCLLGKLQQVRTLLDVMHQSLLVPCLKVNICKSEFQMQQQS